MLEEIRTCCGVRTQVLDSRERHGISGQRYVYRRYKCRGKCGEHFTTTEVRVVKTNNGNHGALKGFYDENYVLSADQFEALEELRELLGRVLL